MCTKSSFMYTCIVVDISEVQIHVYMYYNTITARARARAESPDRRGKDMNDEMTARELDRLADWLTANGMTPEQVLDCLKYIAGTSAPDQESPRS